MVTRHAPEFSAATNYMTEAIIRAYEDLPYPSMAFGQMHPDRLATMATLFGMKPAHPEHCRMLELGCGSGGSLIPFAHALPESRFLGVDITASAIAHAQSFTHKLGLRNVEFRCADILDLREDLGTFDYIAAHGVFSWVPSAVRKKILDICNRHLAPQGVAYLSYNTRPGSDFRRPLRDMMMFHTRNAKSPEEKVRQARALVEFLAEGKAGNEMYVKFMEWSRGRVNHIPDTALFHDDLGVFNDAFFFGEFLQMASTSALQYLSESDLTVMSDRRFEPAIREQLARLSDDLLATEQYADFLYGRAFRETLLCRESVGLDRNLTTERIQQFLFSTFMSPVSPEPDILSASEEEFRAGDSRGLRTGVPLAKAVLVELSQAMPGVLNFSELLERVQVHLSHVQPDQLAQAILEGAMSGPAVELHVCAPSCARRTPARPRLSPIAKLQIEVGAKSVVTLRCSMLEVADPMLRFLLALLDGTRDREALIPAITEKVRAGELQPPASADNDERPFAQFVAEGVDRNLETARKLGLLVAEE